MREAGGELRQKTDLFQGLLDLILPVMIVLIKVEVNQTFRDDVVHFGAFVQGGHGILENHLHGADDFLIHLPGDLAADAFATEEDLTGGDGINPDNGTANGRLAGTGLTHQGEGLAFVNGEIHVVNCHKLLAAAPECHLHIPDLNQCLAVGVFMRMIGIGIRALFLFRLGELADGLRLLHLRSPGITDPGLDHVGGRHLVHRRFLKEVDVQRFPVARRKGIALDFIKEVGRRSVDGRQLLALHAQLRQCREQRPGVGMPGIKEHLVGHADLDDLSGVHDRHPVCHVGHNAQIMSDVDDGHPALFLQASDQVQDLGLNGHIQGGGGLIADQDLRIASHGNGNDDALAHAAGKLVGILLVPAFRIMDAHRFQNPVGFLFRRGAFQSLMQLNGFLNLLSYRFQRVQAGHGILCHHGNFLAADTQPVLFLKLGQILPVIVNAAVGDGPVLVQHADKGLGKHAFAGTGFTHDRQCFALVQVKGGPTDGRQFLSAKHKGDLHLFRRKQRFLGKNLFCTCVKINRMDICIHALTSFYT